MSRLIFLIYPEKLFSILEKMRDNHDFFVIFRRSKSENIEAGFRVLHQEYNLHEIYNLGKYQQIYLSITGIPEYEQDWNFPDRNADNLIVIDGGRIQGNSLEVCEARIFSKTTYMKPVFNKLKRLIIKVCSKKGLYTETGNFYKDIYYDGEILDYKFYFNLCKNDERYALTRKD
jgi:hypothetical protein